MFRFVQNRICMSNDTKDIETLLKSIQEGLKKYSLKELNEAIINILNKKSDKTLEIDYVLTLVCDEFSVSKTTLKSKNARGVLQDAKQIAYCLLHLNLGLSIRYISNNVFHNWPTSVAIGVKRFKTSDIKYKQDKEFIDKYVKLETKLIQNITTQKQIKT
jgi:chromosomal replication initiation ATPase DnaA